MINTNMNWYGGGIKDTVVATAWENLRRAVEYYHQKLLEAVSVPNTGVRVKRKRGKGTYTIYPHPAPKGMPPRLRTGWLRKHVQREYDKQALKARVGLASGAIYGLFLELKNHPWLVATLKKYWQQIKTLAGG